MADARAQDLLSLDRDVARGWRALAAWRAALSADPEGALDDAPLEPVRHVAGKSTWDALRALEPGAAEAPLRDALVPWVGVLTTGRIVAGDEMAWARAAAKPAGRYEGQPARRVSWREAWRGVAGARTAAEAQRWLDAAAECAVELADVARTRASRRLEVARRLGLPHPWALLGVDDAEAVRAAARRLLDATEDLSRAVWRDAPRDRAGATPGAADVLVAAVARDAGEGWPARLAPRWLEELFGAQLAGLRLELPRLPQALGAASFARALQAFGFTVRVAAAPSGLPFAIAHDPASRAAHRLGFVFGALAADADWQRRALGLGTRTALRQARHVARTALLDARMRAARVLLGDDAALAPRDLFEELGTRLLGGALDPRLRGAWPAAADDEPARLVALVEARAFAAGLRERFDLDWWRNPRAWAHLRAVSAVPAREPIDAAALAEEVDALARAFEGALG
jgi:hypothetical protein